MPQTNEEFFEIAHDALVGRLEYEKRLSKYERQRYALDRPRINNEPWNNASNIRYPLADMIIEQKKAFYSQIIYASQYLATFKALSPGNMEYANLCEPYFHHIIDERTDFYRQAIYALDSGLQDGNSYIKTLWDFNKQVPIFKRIENLLVILPQTTAHIEDAPWFIEVIHMSEDEARKRFGQLPDFEALLKRSMSSENAKHMNDVIGRQRERYMRRGINLSGENKTFVLWELHYSSEYKDGTGRDRTKRLRTICPDDPKFDFQDDREYPFINTDGSENWMVEHFRREYLLPDCYSSRGVPEIVQEYEYLLSAVWRMKHNAMTLMGQPVFTAPSGLPTGSTNNISLIPGSILPGNLAPVQWPTLPFSWDQEMLNTRSVAERRMSVPDVALGRSDVLAANGQRTARETSFIEGLQNLSVNYETQPWKKFIRSVLRQGWQRISQFKPQSLSFYIENTIKQLPQEAMNGDYYIDLSWSVDNINPEFKLQKAQALWQFSINNPVANVQEAWKNLVDHLAPGQSQRFSANPEALQADAVEAVANEIDTMVSTGFPVRPKQQTDHYLAVVTTMQYIQAQQHTGMPIRPDRLNLLNSYMIAHREMLKQSNPQQYQLLSQHLNELDMAQKQQQAMQLAAQRNGMALNRGITPAQSPDLSQVPINGNGMNHV